MGIFSTQNNNSGVGCREQQKIVSYLIVDIFPLRPLRLCGDYYDFCHLYLL